MANWSVLVYVILTVLVYVILTVSGIFAVALWNEWRKLNASMCLDSVCDKDQYVGVTNYTARNV